MPTSGVDDRKIAILRRVIEHYVSTGQPVGSSHIASLPGVTVSAATVRNEMAALEAEGLLAQPHTSAGRVPTDKGYRLYVDHLTSTDVAKAGKLAAAQRQQLGDFFDTAHLRLEDTLHRTSLLLAQLTNYTAVVTGPSAVEAEVRSVQVVSLNDHTGTVVAVLSSGEIVNEPIEFDVAPTDAQLAKATERLRAAFIGKTLSSVSFAPRGADAAGRGATLAPMLRAAATHPSTRSLRRLQCKPPPHSAQVAAKKTFLLAAPPASRAHSMRWRLCARCSKRSSSNTLWCRSCVTC